MIKKSLVKAKNSIGLALRIVFALAIIAVIIWKFKELQNIDVRALIEAAGSLPKTLITILGVYLVKGLTLIVPASLVYIAVGMSIKIGWALAVNITGIIIEVTVTYILGLILGGPFVTKKLGETKAGKRILGTYEKHEKGSIFIMRILGLPIDFCSLFFGAMRVRYIPYLLMSLAGILPRVILFTILGDKVYDLVPMKYVVSVAAVAVTVFLIVWIIKYIIKSIRSEDSMCKPAYTPLCEEKRSVILDTDIGPDCDDAGAIALLFELKDKYGIPLLGINNCTSNIYGNSAIKAICEYYGLDEPKVGCHKNGTPILPDNSKYSREITKQFCKYENSAVTATDELDFYTELLTGAEDDSVVIITIGMFTSIAAALDKDPVLFNKKVHAIVSMAGKYPSGKEFNISTDPISAQTVLEKFKNLMVFSGFEVGKSILTGFPFNDENNPVNEAYRLHTDMQAPPYISPSFDLTAVQYAFEGNGEFYALSKPQDIKVDINGNMKTEKNKFSNRYFIIRKADPESIADYYNSLLTKKPAEKGLENK